MSPLPQRCINHLDFQSYLIVGHIIEHEVEIEAYEEGDRCTVRQTEKQVAETHHMRERSECHALCGDEIDLGMSAQRYVCTSTIVETTAMNGMQNIVNR